jgi:hypothetical protein
MMEQKSEKPLPGGWMKRRHTSCTRARHRRRGTLRAFTSPLDRCRKPTLAVTKAGSTTDFMNRLPSYDRQTSTSELRFFLGLGLAAISIIAITGVDAARFSGRRQEIAAALSNQSPSTALAGAPTNTVMALTNLATLRPDPAEERSRLGPIAKPKS